MKEVNKILINLKTPILVVAIAMFLFNYTICDFFYWNEETNKFINKKLWWFLKCDIYRFSLLLLAVSYAIGQKGWIRFFLELFIGFLLASLMDDNHLEINKRDVIMAIAAVLYASYELIKEKRDARLNK